MRKPIAKLFSSLLITSSVMLFPVLTHAADIHIANNSETNLSFNINNACSAEWGVVSAKTIGMISNDTFKKSCEYAPNACVVNMYASDDCSGQVVGNITFDVDEGVTGIITNAQGYSIGGNGFNVFINGPGIK